MFTSSRRSRSMCRKGGVNTPPRNAITAMTMLKEMDVLGNGFPSSLLLLDTFGVVDALADPAFFFESLGAMIICCDTVWAQRDGEGYHS